MIIPATHQQIAALCKVTGLVPTPYVKGISQVIENVTTAVTVYDRWTENAVEMHVWIPGRMTPGFVRACFEYPFVQAGKGLVIALSSGNNAAVLALNLRLGFRQVYKIKDGNAVGDDLILQEMRKEECRWIRRLN